MRISDWSSDVCSSDLISTVGTKSNAVHAYSGDEGATGHDTADSAFVTLDGGSVSTTGSDSYGLSAQNNGAVITATGATGNTSITTTGANSFGASAYNGGTLDLTESGRASRRERVCREV